MRKFAIISDTACDLNAEMRERLDMQDYLHGILYFPDGHEELSDLDWGNISPEAYYESMKDKKALYRTACATIGETTEVFEKHLAQGEDVLSIAMSSGLSCTYQNCCAVAEELRAKYPERKIICVDSLRYSTSLAVLLMLADEKRQAGATIEETAAYVEKMKHCVHQMGPMDDLFFLVKRGRISNFKAFFGTLVGVNPMADFNHQGMATVLGKFKGKRAAFDATIKYMEKTIVNPQEQTIFVAHSNREQAAQTLAEMIKEKFSPKEIIINPVGQVCGAAIGPGLCAAFYVGTPISEDCVNEKAIMDEIVNAKPTAQEAKETAEKEVSTMITNGSFAVLSDSTCDLAADVREKYSIDYVKMNYVIDGTEYPASLDWENHSAREYYDLMRGGKRVTTTQVTRDTYLKAFTAHLEAGRDVVYVSCSSALSGSVNLATLIAEELKEKYPNNRVYCVDSLCSSLGQGMMVLKAAMMRDEGKTAEETAAFITANRLKVNQYGTVASLEYLRRAGRVKASKAFFGNLFGVKPIILSDVIGQNFAFKKVKGTLNARLEIARLIVEAAEDPENSYLFLSHADCEEDIEALKEEILKLAPFKGVMVSCIGPIVGASVGPGTVIAFVYGQEVTIEGKE